MDNGQWTTYRLRLNLPPFNPPINTEPLPLRHINHPIDDNMRDMHALGPEFPSQRLPQGAKCELPGGEGAEVGGALYGGRCSCDQEGRWVCGCSGGG